MQILIDEDKTVKRRRQKASAAKTFRLAHPERVAASRYRANMIKNCGSANEHRAIAEWMEK